MRKLLTASAAAVALIGVAVTAAAPADARGWGGYHGGYGRGGYGYHGGYYGGSGAVIGAGILGLAVGAAIASDRPYYRGGYGYGAGYYAPPPPPPGYGYGEYCRTDWRWDGYARRYVPVQYCN